MWPAFVVRIPEKSWVRANVVAKLKIKYAKSAIGYAKTKDTIAALGLSKLGSEVVHEDTPAIRGMVRKVRYLVEVEEVNSEGV